MNTFVYSCNGKPQNHFGDGCAEVLDWPGRSRMEAVDIAAARNWRCSTAEG